MKVETAIVPALSWCWKRFDDLTAGDVYDLLALRSEVFVVEQRCVFLDPDGSDRRAWHLLGRTVADAPLLAAYLRVIDPGVKYREPSIGRVVTAPSLRGLGLGRVLMDAGLLRSHDAWPGSDLVINAQLRLEPFYRSLGFRSEGAPYVEDDIDHVQMRHAGAP
jgi:ElaA protein